MILHNSLTPTRLNPSFGSINYAENAAEARYDSFIADLRGRFRNNFSFDISYTRSRSLDDTQLYPTFGNLSQYYGPSSWDASNRVSAYWSYQFPNFNDNQGFSGRLLSGWTITGTSSDQSGNPFTVYTGAAFQPIKNASGTFIGYAPGSGDYNADGVNYDYPDVSTYQLHYSRQAYLGGLFPAGIISQPAFGSEGSEKPNQYRNPGFFETDASLLKDVRIVERLSLQLRFEFYNIFNHPNLNGIDSNLADGTFGKSTSEANPRWMQIGARLTF